MIDLCEHLYNTRRIYQNYSDQLSKLEEELQEARSQKGLWSKVKRIAELDRNINSARQQLDSTLNSYKRSMVILPAPGDEALFEELTGVSVKKHRMDSENKGIIITRDNHTVGTHPENPNFDTDTYLLLNDLVLGIIHAQPIRADSAYSSAISFYGWPVVQGTR